MKPIYPLYLKILLLGIISLITLTSFSNELINAEPSNKIPLWSKILIDWWLEEKISDIEFMKSLTFLINSGIIKTVESESIETDIFDLSSIENSKVGKFSIFYMSICLLYTSPSPRDNSGSRMPSSA